LFGHVGLLGGETGDLDAAGFRADEITDGATGAAGTGVLGRMIAVVVEALGKMQDFGRAGFDTKPATLTFFCVHLDGTAIWLDWHRTHLQDRPT
jgi:hypothetical protein